MTTYWSTPSITCDTRKRETYVFFLYCMYKRATILCVLHVFCVKIKCSQYFIVHYVLQLKSSHLCKANALHRHIQAKMESQTLMQNASATVSSKLDQQMYECPDMDGHMRLVDKIRSYDCCLINRVLN